MEENNNSGKDQGESQIYEVGYHLLPSVPEENVAAKVSEIRALINGLGGEMVAEGVPAMRALAYEIAKKIDTKLLRFNKAYFGWLKFEIERPAVVELQKKLEALPEMLRFIVVKTVRENTLHTPKVPSFRKEDEKDEVVVVADSEKPAASEAEIDKSIDELVAS